MDSNRTCLVKITIYSTFRKDENYYLKFFYKECKYIGKEKKVIRHITDDLEIYSDESNKE